MKRATSSASGATASANMNVITGVCESGVQASAASTALNRLGDILVSQAPAKKKEKPKVRFILTLLGSPFLVKCSSRWRTSKSLRV